MNTEMFCFQCEQTAGCSGCTGKAGVCGKKAETAGLQDRLTGALISLAKDEERAGREKLPEDVYKRQPVKLDEYKIHQDPPGISGELVEGRIVYDLSLIHI